MRLTQLLATGLLVGGLASTVNADQITVSNTIPSFTTDDTQTASLPFFQSAPGFVAGDVLTGVQIEIDAMETISSLTITNNAAGPEKFKFSSTGSICQTAGCDGITPVSTAPGASSIPEIDMVTFATTTITLPGHGTTSPIPPPVTTDFNSGLVSELASAYATTGTFTLGFSTVNGFSFTGGGGNLSASEDTTAQGSIEAIYTFTPGTTPPPPVPEPGSIFMVGGVLMLAGYQLRKRYNRAS